MSRSAEKWNYVDEWRPYGIDGLKLRDLNIPEEFRVLGTEFGNW